MSFRWRRGRFSTSLSRGGPRVSYRLGCTLPVALALAALTVLLKRVIELG
jgi:hypothetical protein